MALTVRELLVSIGVDADTADVRKFDRAVDKAKNSMGDAERRAGTLSVTLGNVLAEGFFIASRAAGRMVTGLVQTNIEAQNLMARLHSVEGSAEAAGEKFDELSQFAAQTPFELNKITDAYVQLRVRGFEANDRTLTALGDTAAAFGATLQDSVRAANGLLKGEAEAFESVGGRAKFSGDQIQVTYDGVTKTIRRNTESIEQYLTAIGEEQWAGSMDRQAKTVGGAFSNLQDALFQFSFAVGRAGLNDALNETVRTITGMIGGSENLAQTIGAILATAVRRFNALLIWVQRNGATVRRVLTDLGKVLAGLAWAKAVSGMLKFVKTLNAINIAATAPAIKLAIIAGAVLLLLLALDDLVAFMQGRPSLIGDMLGEDSEQANQLRGAIETLVDAGKRVLGILTEAIAGLDITPIDLLIGALVVVLTLVENFIVGLVVIGTFLGRAGAWIYLFFTETIPQAIDSAIEWFRNAWHSAGQFFAGIVQGMIDLVIWLGETLIGLFLAPIAVIAAGWQWLFDTIDEIFGGLADWFSETVLDPLSAAFDGVFGFIGGLIDDTFGAIGELVDEAAAASEKVAAFFGLADEVDVSGVAGNIQQGIIERGESNGLSANVEGVTVQVGDSGTMTEGELRRAAAKGTNEGMQRALREANRQTR